MACNRLSAFLALPFAVSLILGAASWDARADICKKQNPRKGCVNSVDVENQSLGPNQIKDEAGFRFGRFNKNDGVSLGSTDKTITGAGLKVPRKGWVVATANVEIQAAASAEGSVRCEIAMIRGGKVIARKPFYESVAFDSGIERGTVAATFGFKVSKAGIFAKLSCRRLSGGALKVSNGGIALQYFPTRYLPKPP